MSYVSVAKAADPGFEAGRRSNYLIFFAGGFIVSPWSAIAPVIKLHFALSDMAFAVMSMCFGVGAVIAMSQTGRAIGRWGVKRVSTTAIVLCALCMLCVSLRFLPWEFLYLSSFGWGAFLGTYEVSASVHATYFEEISGKRMLPGFMAVYTAGALFSAMFFPLLLHFGVEIELVTFMVMLMSYAFFFPIRGRMVDTHGQKSAAAVVETGENSLSRVALLVGGMIALFALLAEGTIFDWGGVYLVQDCAVPLSYAALGYLLYECGTGTIRIFGNRLLRRFGPRRLLTCCSGTAAAAMLLASLNTSPVIVCLCFGLLGLSAGNIMPAVLSETGKRCGRDKARAIGFVSAMGYAGVLTGPAALGLVATFSGLAYIFMFVALLMLCMGVMCLKFFAGGRP